MAFTRRLTLDEFLALPEEKPALELESDGTVVRKASPQGQHSRLQLAICERINRFAESRRLALAFLELRVLFGGAAYVPDVSYSPGAGFPGLTRAKWPTCSIRRPISPSTSPHLNSSRTGWCGAASRTSTRMSAS